MLFKARKRTVVHGIRVLGVCYAWNRVVLPVQVAGLDGQLKSREEFRVRSNILLLLAAVRGDAHTVLGHSVQDLQVPGSELCVQHVAFVGCQAGIQCCQTPQHDDLIAEGRTSVLGGV